VRERERKLKGGTGIEERTSVQAGNPEHLPKVCPFWKQKLVSLASLLPSSLPSSGSCLFFFFFFFFFLGIVGPLVLSAETELHRLLPNKKKYLFGSSTPNLFIGSPTCCGGTCLTFLVFLKSKRPKKGNWLRFYFIRKIKNIYYNSTKHRICLLMYFFL
jgi:hypothetical protein